MLEALQEQFGEGPCVDAFLEDEPVLGEDVAADPRWPSVGPLAVGHGVRAVLGVPIDLREGPVGTLNVYATQPHRWDHADVAAIQAYTRVIASLLRSATRAHVSGKAASQLQHALDHRSLIEQAKGMLMERRGLDQQAAFELLRSRARSTRRRLDEVVGGGGSVGTRSSVYIQPMVVSMQTTLDFDRVFRALADGTRRDIVRRAIAGEEGVAELAEHYPMSFAAVQKHVASWSGPAWSPRCASGAARSSAPMSRGSAAAPARPVRGAVARAARPDDRHRHRWEGDRFMTVTTVRKDPRH